MYLFQRSIDLQNWLQTKGGYHQKIGFVPTMGALHNGHLALVRESLAANDRTICSIFINPTQFNDATDLNHYPRTPERDIELLATSGCDALFMPAVEEVYPKELDTSVSVELGPLDQVLEGAFRPGHFTGVIQVVHRLLQLVQPNRLYMGQKDFQQLTIVREMIRQLQLPVELIPVPIEREEDGLAMSSRNVRLSPHFRQIAPSIYQTLVGIKKDWPAKDVTAWNNWATQQLKDAGLQPEYFEIIDGHSLAPVESFSDSKLILAIMAAWAGDVRLIDNIILKDTPN